MDKPIKIVFDITLGRPACALLQAAMGGDQVVAQAFPSEAWLLTPTPDMALYEVTPEQLQALAARLALVA